MNLSLQSINDGKSVAGICNIVAFNKIISFGSTGPTGPFCGFMDGVKVANLVAGPFTTLNLSPSDHQLYNFQSIDTGEDFILPQNSTIYTIKKTDNLVKQKNNAKIEINIGDYNLYSDGISIDINGAEMVLIEECRLFINFHILSIVIVYLQLIVKMLTLLAAVCISMYTIQILNIVVV